jgi:hypothetical protein
MSTKVFVEFISDVHHSLSDMLRPIKGLLGVDNLVGESLKVYLETLARGSTHSHPLILMDAVRNKIREMNQSCTSFYWPNVPKRLLELILNLYSITGHGGSDRFILIIHTRARMKRMIVKNTDGSSIVVEYMVPARYLIHLIKFHYRQRCYLLYPDYFTIFQVYTSKRFELQSVPCKHTHRSAKIKTLERFEDSILPYTQACTLVYC